MDPPWGGLDYKNNPTSYYTLNGVVHTMEQLLKGPISYIAETFMIRIPKGTGATLLEQLAGSTFTNRYLIEFKMRTVRDNRIRNLYDLVIVSHKEAKNLPTEYVFNNFNYRLIKFTSTKIDS